MSFHTPSFRPLPLPLQVIALVLVIVCLLLGLIGLVLPVIPGLLFLFLAVLLLTRVSRRAAETAHQQRWFRGGLRTWRAAGGLSMAERLRLAALFSARAVVNGIGALARLFRGS